MDKLSALESEGVFLLMSMRNGLFRFTSLPAELRCKIYRYAVVEPHPLPLRTHRYRDRSVGCGVEWDLRMLYTCKEFQTEMSELLYLENSFSYSIPQDEVEQEPEIFRIDPRRILRCQISFEYFRKDANFFRFQSPYEDLPGFMLPIDPDRINYILNDFVTMLTCKPYQMEYLLIECKPQSISALAQALSPLSLLRNIKMVHFRSGQRKMYHFFCFLEVLMTSNLPVRYSDLRTWSKEAISENNIVTSPNGSLLVKGLNADVDLVVRSQEQSDAIAKELYSILGIEGEPRCLKSTIST